MGSSCDLTGNEIAVPPLHIDAAREVMRSLLTALSVLHDKGVIHRDIKPDNLLVWGRGEIPSSTSPSTAIVYPRVKVSDFGLARAIEPYETYSVRVGTKNYRAPELETSSYDERVDVFSAGCTLFALITGRLPSEKPEGFPHRFTDKLSNAELGTYFPEGSLVIHFLTALTQREAIHRISSAKAALEHPFMKINEP